MFLGGSCTLTWSGEETNTESERNKMPTIRTASRRKKNSAAPFEFRKICEHKVGGQTERGRIEIRRLLERGHAV